MTAKQIKALQALLTQPTKAAAAKQAGINESTLRRYLADEEFQREYKAAFSQLVSDATRQAQKSLSPALSALREIVEDDTESSASRIAAARTLLEYGLKLTEFNDILSRIDAIEKTLNENNY